MRTKPYMFLLPAILLFACNKYEIRPEQAGGFIKFYSSTLTEVAYDVKETPDGGYVAVGTTSNEEGMRDLYLIKTDRYGNEVSWSPAIIGGAYDDVGVSMQVEPDGYVILGYSRQTDSTQYDLYLLKTDLEGNLLWEKWEGDPSDAAGVVDDRGLSLQITSAGEYLAAGIRYNPASGNYDYRIARFDQNGSLVKNAFISSGDPAQTVLSASIIETSEYFVICSTLEYKQKKEIQLIPVHKVSHLSVGGERYSSSGDLEGNCIRELTDGNLLVCGTVYNPISGLGGIYLNKISPAPELLPVWESPRTFSVVNDNVSLTGNALRFVNGNQFAIIGTRTETGNDDIILLHSDADGNEISRRIFGDEGFQQGVSLEVTGADGGLILVGNNGAEDQSMMALVKTDAEGRL